jgi:hypothetical protein
VEWESLVPNCLIGTKCFKADPSLKSFLFTLKNPHNFPATKFARTDERFAICCESSLGPDFCDIGISNHCNARPDSWTSTFGHSYTNDTGLDGKTFFTGSRNCTVTEIEVFEITD